MIVFRRAVKFEEIDAARVVFFGAFLTYAHDAMEAFFAGLPGGYPALIMERDVGLPAVHVETDYTAPLRYGDALRIEITTAKLGTKSATLRHRMIRERDGALSCVVLQTVVTTALTEMRAVAMPDDVRAILAAHLEP